MGWGVKPRRRRGSTGWGRLFDRQPGDQRIGARQIDAAALAYGFREISEPARACRFTDCTHLRSRTARLRRPLRRGEISPEPLCQLPKDPARVRPGHP